MVPSFFWMATFILAIKIVADLMTPPKETFCCSNILIETSIAQQLIANCKKYCILHNQNTGNMQTETSILTKEDVSVH